MNIKLTQQKKNKYANLNYLNITIDIIYADTNKCMLRNRDLITNSRPELFITRKRHLADRAAKQWADLD